MNLPSVSIIVPVYNVERFVENCIRSVMRQTYDGNIECVVVDDCGTDNSMGIVEKLVFEYNGPISFKIVHHTSNRGLSAARNTGISNASGDYLLFLDSDDWLHEDICKETCNCAYSHHADLVMFNQMRLWGNEGETDRHAKSYKYSTEGFKTQTEAIDIILEDEGTAAWNKLYRRNLFDKITYPEGFYYEDEGTSYKIIIQSSCIYYLDKVLYYHYWHPGCITTLGNKKVWNDRAMMNVQRYCDLQTWGYKSEKLDYLFIAFALNYFVKFKRSKMNSTYLLVEKVFKSIRKMPKGFSTKQVFIIYLYRFCPLFVDYYTRNWRKYE